MNRLLIVEDQASLRISLADDMREAGFQVYEASSGHEAVILLDQYSFVGVITDLKIGRASCRERV